MHSTSSERVLVIGAGPAGLAAAAALKTLGVEFDLVDAQNHVGGVWNVGNDDAPSWPAMRMVSSKQHSQFDDLRMPVNFPAYPSTDQYATYLRAYASHHALTEVFEPNMAVRRARPFSEGQWEVEFSNGEVRPYTAVIAAHGVSNRPFLPPLFFEAKESGVPTIHSNTFPGAEYTTAKSVLVVGSGQSAADIATELADGTRRVALHMKEGHWVVPRNIGPFAGDSLALNEPSILGRKFNEAIAEKLVTSLVGHPHSAGLPAPTATLLNDEPIVSDDFVKKVEAHQIEVLQDERHLPFEAFDQIIFATGYEPGVDYLDPELTEDLFLGAFPRTRRDLAVLGQVRVVGGVMPILIQQADIAAYQMKELLEELHQGHTSSKLANFDELKARAERDVPCTARTTVTSAKGLRGKVTGLASQVRTAVRSSALSHDTAAWFEEAELADDQPITIPMSDRESLLGRLHTARKIFE